MAVPDPYAFVRFLPPDAITRRLFVMAPAIALRHPWGLGVCLTPVDEPRCGCGHYLLTWHVVVEHEGGGTLEGK